MKLNYNVTEIAPVIRHGAAKSLMESFIASGAPIAEIEDVRASKTIYATLMAARKRHGLDVDIVKRGDKIYLAQK